MSFTLNPYTLLGLLFGTLLLLAVSAFSGWHVRGWHDDAAQLKGARADTDLLTQQFNGVINASNNLAAIISQKNQATEASIAGLTTTLGDQSHALSQLRFQIKSIPVGTCSFTPAADSLLQRAYQASFGTATDPATTAGKTGSGHAIH